MTRRSMNETAVTHAAFGCPRGCPWRLSRYVLGGLAFLAVASIVAWVLLEAGRPG